MREGHWVGFDLDRSLANYKSGMYTLLGKTHIGDPIEESIWRLHRRRKAGWETRIFTARDASDPEIKAAIEDWCIKHTGLILPITNIKDRFMEAIYDDRAIQLEPNTGKILGHDFLEYD